MNQAEKQKTITTIAIMLAITFLIWDNRILAPLHLGFLSFIIYPIKLFVVFLHEISHGLAAIVTGGTISHIEISPLIGGVCYHTSSSFWPIRTFIASAGYLGSILWGCLLLFLAIRTKYNKTINIVIGSIMLIVLVLWMRDLFTVIFTGLFGIFMIFSGRKLSEEFNDLILKYIGVVSCLYAFLDIPEDLIFRTVSSSDSYAIASSVGMPFLSVPIGILWLVLSALCLYQTYKITMK